MSEPRLFEAAPAHDDPRWVVVTNDANVLEWMSSSLLTPKLAFVKHYADVLDLRDDVVPVVPAPAAPALIAHASSERSTRCVLVEVDETAVAATKNADVGVLLPRTIACVRAVHVRSDDERSELRARRYDNVPADAVPIVVSPELFGTNGPDEVAVRRALETVGRVKTAVEYVLADRLGGARALAVLMAPADRALPELIRSLLCVPPPRATRRKPRTAVDWLTISARLARTTPRKTASYDQQLFEIAASVLLEREPRSVFDPSAVLSAIDAQVMERDTIAASDKEHWTQAKRWMDGLLTGERPFTRFRNPGFRSEKALLLTLVRPEPHTVVTWRDESIGAHPHDLLVAGVLVGLTNGRTMMPAAMRPRALDERLARRQLADLHPDLPPATAEAVVEVVERSGRSFLLIDDEAVRELPPEAARAPVPQPDLELDSPAVREALVAVCRQQGWDDAVITTVAFAGELRMRPQRGGATVEARGFPAMMQRPDLTALRRHIADTDDDTLRADLLRLIGEHERS